MTFCGFFSDFWDDLRNESSGIYVWCETADGLTCLTVSRQCHSPTRHLSSCDDPTLYSSADQRSLDSNTSLNAPTYEGANYRYRTMNLLTLDRKAPAIRIIDIVVVVRQRFMSMSDASMCFSFCFIRPGL